MTTLVLSTPNASIATLEPLQQAVFGYLSRYRGRTLAAYQHDLTVFLSWCGERQLPPLQAKRPHLELYVRWMQEESGWSESTISRRIGTVCGFYKYAALDDLIAKDPSVAVDRPKVDHEKQRRTWLKPLHFSYLLAVSRDQGAHPHALVALLGMCGLRISEACSLDIENVGEQSGYTTVSFIGKGNKAATIGLPPPVARAVKDAIGDRTSGPVLLNTKGRRMDRSSANRLIKRLAAIAGVSTDISPHSLRRSFCTTGLINKVPIYEMQLAMRHASTATTARYDMMAQSLDRNASYQIAGALSSMVS